MKKNNLKLLDMLCDYTTKKQEESLVVNPSMNILEIVRYNAYRAMVFDDIENNLEPWLEELSESKLKYLIEKDVIQRVYNEYEKCDGYDNCILVDYTNSAVRDLLKEMKENKKKVKGEKRNVTKSRVL